jgi:ABC-type iron transport system FetAB ATPase subunit
LIVGIILLAIYVNFYVVIVVGMMIIALGAAGKLGQQIGTKRFGLQKFGDKRLKVINELSICYHHRIGFDKKGDLITIVGPVGKWQISSFIQALLGEIPKVSGSLSVAGTQAYVSQEAFIVNTTVRENIIFGKPFDMKKYREVLKHLLSCLTCISSQQEIAQRSENEVSTCQVVRNK